MRNKLIFHALCQRRCNLFKELHFLCVRMCVGLCVRERQTALQTSVVPGGIVSKGSLQAFECTQRVPLFKTVKKCFSRLPNCSGNGGESVSPCAARFISIISASSRVSWGIIITYSIARVQNLFHFSNSCCIHNLVIIQETITQGRVVHFLSHWAMCCLPYTALLYISDVGKCFPSPESPALVSLNSHPQHPTKRVVIFLKKSGPLQDSRIPFCFD